MADFVEITNTNPSIDNFAKFRLENLISGTDQELLDYEDNAASTLASYRPGDPASATIDLLRTPTLLKVPLERILKETVVAGGNVVVNNEEFNAFIDDRISAIVNDPSYRPLEISQEQNGSKTFRINNSISVWAFCKALGSDDTPGKIINLTPFIQTVTTNSGDNGGNFSLVLQPVTGELVDGEWALRKSSLFQFAYKGVKNIMVRDASVIRRDNVVERNNLLFDKILSANDVIFIRMETLESEKGERADSANSNNDLDNLIVDFKELRGKNFDMIALVDEVRATDNAPNTDLAVNVGGRDLMKLLIEDGTYVYPVDFVTNLNQYKDKSSRFNKAIDRIVTGDFSFLSGFLDRSVEFSLKFIFNILSNAKIVDEKLFSGYNNDDLTKRFEFQSKINEESGDFDEEQLKKTNAAGIWSIVKAVIDPQVASRRLVDSSIIPANGSLLNFVNKVAQKPFVEFYGDTYGNQYYFITRKPPYDFESYSSNTIIDIGEEDVYSDDLFMNDQDVYSWYRLIPRGNFFGGDNGVSLLEFPAKFFEEYAEIWGSKVKEVVSNYIDYQGFVGEEGKVSLEYLEQQALQDLAFVVESNAYNPFVRKGTIQIKGDRRIRRGINVRYKPTGEIFYVDNVTQTFANTENSNDRTTQITVSRGMVERYLQQYFRIIEFDRNQLGVIQSGDMVVNRDLFNFFLKRRQFGG